MRIAVFISCLLIFSACTREEIKLEKIIFHTSRCFGSCPAYHSQIDRDKSLLLFSEYVASSSDKNANPDTSKMGYFAGRVSDRLYNELEHELQNIKLDDLSFDGQTCCDGSVVRIIVYYNGKRKFLKSMFPPTESVKLISILRNITESTSTQRTDKEFEIEYTE